MLDIEKLTVGEVREIAKLAGCVGGSDKSPEKCVPLPFKEGDKVLFRTVTMIQLGRVKAIGSDFFVLEDGGWVADTARFSKMLETGELNEFEKAPKWCLVARGALVDAWPWDHDLPKATK